MTPDQHAQVKEIFLKARDLAEESRDEFLRHECGGDEELLQEVTSLIRHDTTRTILAPPIRSELNARRSVGVLPGRLLSRVEQEATSILRRILLRPSRRLLAIVVVALLLGGLASWTFRGMKRATLSVASSELQTILNADVKALELWIEEKKKDIRIWSSLPKIRESVGELSEIAASADDPAEALRASPSLQELRNVLESFDRITGRPERDAVVTRDGLLLAAGRDDLVGQRLNADGAAVLAPVFQGQTLFLKPRPGGVFGIEQEQPDDDQLPMLYVVAPIYAADADPIDSTVGSIVAAAAFGFPADDEFTEIISVARQGETGETYTFDENGLMLNECRFDDELRSTGLMPDAPNSRSILRMEVRDPGSQRSEWAASSVDAAARPLTVLAARAIAAGRKGNESDQQGVILEPYRNYRGAEVIGAWKWLPPYALGIATEVEVVEQYAPMRYPLIAEWTRFAMLAGCIALLLGAASWIALLGSDLEEARQLGQYTLEEEIGRGGMGVVYRAKHALLHRPTAIKMLRPEIASEDALKRFEREAQLASGLTHPNTVDVFDFGRTPEGSFYCVMEFLEGQTLDELVRTEGALPASRALHILGQIAGALSEAHQRGLVHRDIKPSNIMLCHQGGIPDFVKVLDFGLARTVARDDIKDITPTGIVVGTPPYLAPERITDPTTIDPRSDIYSFGAVAYFLLTGRKIHEAANNGDLIRQVIQQEPRLPSMVTDNEIPHDLEELVMHCVAMHLDDRPETIGEVMVSMNEASTAEFD